jgi:hypothetical protein
VRQLIHPRNAFIALALVFASSSYPASAEGIAGESLRSSLHPESAPPGITANLEGVPDLTAVEVPKPYSLGWQKRILALQNQIEEDIQAASEPAIDPSLTGSIGEVRSLRQPAQLTYVVSSH